MKENEMMKTDAEAAYKLGDRYISIQQTDDGIDYSIYDEGYKLLDGGVFDDPEMTIEGALKEITEDLKQPVYDPATDKYDHVKIQGSIKPSDIPEPVDYDDLMERVEEIGLSGIEAVKSGQDTIEEFRNKTDTAFHTEQFYGMSPAEIESAVTSQVQTIVRDLDLDVRVEDVILSGSRCRGLEHRDSDLDVILIYYGSEKEEDLYNTLHSEKMYMGSDMVELDIEPLSVLDMERVVNHISETEAYLQGLAAVTEIAEQNQKQDKERLDKATEYKPLAKVEELTEQNYNMIDNVLNNMPKPPVDEEEQKREKLRKISEDKINRRNTSMKERIAQKKALIAVKDAQKTGLANYRNIPGSEMDN